MRRNRSKKPSPASGVREVAAPREADEGRKAAPRKPLDLRRIEAFRASLKPSKTDSVTRIRAMARY